MTTVPRLLLTSEERLQRLRDILHEFGIDAYVIPTADAHASECPPDTDKRRMYMTGFTGSAGTAVVTRESALLWTDSRCEKSAVCNVIFQYVSGIHNTRFKFFSLVWQSKSVACKVSALFRERFCLIWLWFGSQKVLRAGGAGA